MFRSIKRWWAKITHRHEWVVVFRGWLKWKRISTGARGRNQLILERCYCGRERCREFEFGQWSSVDLDWLDCELHDKGIEIPARTHGVKA